MASNKPILRKPQDDQPPVDKPYQLIRFPQKPPTLRHPVGHDRYRADRLHGVLHLTLTVQTALHISTGVVALGSDVGARIPLIKTMAQGTANKLVIPGSSLKGVVRSAYEAITNSTLAVATNKYKSSMPSERLPCRDKTRLCPASQVFGALDWQGLLHFTDAHCEEANAATGFMPSLYRPRPDERDAYFQKGKAVGRKFYYHATNAVDGSDRGIPVQQAGIAYSFTTRLQFMNLTEAELGTLLIVLGQDKRYPLALKVGGGKPIGMGTMTATVTGLERAKHLRDRYAAYTPPESDRLTGVALESYLQDLVKAAHKKLIQTPQLQQLAEVLKWPTERTAPSGMY